MIVVARTAPIDARRVTLTTVAGVLPVLAVAEIVVRLGNFGNALGWGPDSDFAFYRNVGRLWLDTGQLYTQRQLAGPYTFVPNITVDFSVLYPPIALALFVPFAMGLPPILWWVLPLAIIGWSLYRFRPADWAWPLIALCVFWPETTGKILLGSTDLWACAAVAGGLLWGWPAVLLAIKPTLLPFCLVGIRRRSWWFVAVVVAAASLAMLPLWSQYVVAMRNLSTDLTYVLESVPILLIPVIAYVGRVRDRPLVRVAIEETS